MTDPIAIRVAARFAAAVSPLERDALQAVIKADEHGEPLELHRGSRHLPGARGLERKKLVTIDEGESSFMVTLTDKGYAYVEAQAEVAV